MNRILELTQKRAALYDAANAILQTIETEKRAGTPEELSAIDGHRVEMEALTRTILAAQQIDAMRPEPGTGGQARREPGEVHNNAEDRPFESFGHQLRSIYLASQQGAVIDPRLQKRAATGAGESEPSGGGFLVAPEFISTLIEKTYNTGQISSRCFDFPVSSNNLNIPAVDETSRVNGSRYGGVQAFWSDEGGAITASNPKFRKIELRMKKLTALCYATDELLMDSAALGAYMNRAFAQEMSFKVDDAIMRGTGAGQPQGILNSGCLVTQAAEAAQTATTVNMANIAKMWARLWAPSQSSNGLAWFINQDVFPQLYQLAATGTTPAFPVFLPPGGLAGKMFSSLMGAPIIPVETCSTLGAVGDIILADMKQYYLARRQGLDAATSIHVRFVNDETAFRFIMRLDGQPAWNSTLTPYKGSNTQSPFIALAAR